jgi:hypothetical protein
VAGFHNVILCEDIRDEVGNKKSLMGVFSGDIVVQGFPAQVQFAIYLEYIADNTESEATFEFRLMDGEKQMAKGNGVASLLDHRHAVIVIPRGLAIFTAETTLRLLMSIEGKPETQILSKRILQISS